MTFVGVDQDHQVVSEPRIFDIGVLAVACDLVSEFTACSRPTASAACLDVTGAPNRCDRRRDAAAHADGLAARRAAGLRHDSTTKPERRGPPSDDARAREAAAGA